MTTMIQNEDAARDMAVEMSKPGKFSMIERLQGRNMPVDVVTIYLDEEAGYDRAKLAGERASATDPEVLAELDEKLNEADQRIRDSVAHIHMRGISSEDYDELLDKAKEQYPVEYEEHQSAFSLVRDKAEVESPERDLLSTQLYLSACITFAEMGGDIDEDITPDWVAQFLNIAPLDAVRLVTETAYKLRMAVQWMDEIQNEDFSPRP